MLEIISMSVSLIGITEDMAAAHLWEEIWKDVDINQPVSSMTCVMRLADQSLGVIMSLETILESLGWSTFKDISFTQQSEIMEE